MLNTKMKHVSSCPIIHNDWLNDFTLSPWLTFSSIIWIIFCVLSVVVSILYRAITWKILITELYGLMIHKLVNQMKECCTSWTWLTSHKSQKNSELQAELRFASFYLILFITSSTSTWSPTPPIILCLFSFVTFADHADHLMQAYNWLDYWSFLFLGHELWHYNHLGPLGHH